jgi:hypothetical protein
VSRAQEIVDAETTKAARWLAQAEDLGNPTDLAIWRNRVAYLAKVVIEHESRLAELRREAGRLGEVVERCSAAATSWAEGDFEGENAEQESEDALAVLWTGWEIVRGFLATLTDEREAPK